MNTIVAHADPNVRKELSEALAELGSAAVAEVDSIASLKAALREIGSGVLVTAWELADGEPLPALRDAPDFKQWAVVVVHPNVDLPFWRRARAAGAHAVVAYPGADRKQLRARVEAAVEAHRRTVRPNPPEVQQVAGPTQAVRPSRIVDGARAVHETIVARPETAMLLRPGAGQDARVRQDDRQRITDTETNGVAHVAQARGQDTSFAGVIAWIGALPRCGTTTALGAWALAQAEAGSRIVVVDANLERPGLSMVLCGETALSGWDVTPPPSAARLQRSLMTVPGMSDVKVLPLAWAPGQVRLALDQVTARLPTVIDAAERAGAVTVAIDLGSFQPLHEGVPDPRLRWVARAADAVVVVAPMDVWGVDAAARMVVALRSCGARRVTVLLTQGATEDDAAAVVDLFAGMSPPVHADHVLAVPWRPEIVPRRIGEGPPPIRLASVLRPGGRSGVSQAVPVRP